MNDPRWLDLWTRREGAGDLAPDDDRALADRLRADAAAGNQAAEDDALGADLRTLGRTASDSDEFVERVMARVMNLEPAPPPVAPPLPPPAHTFEVRRAAPSAAPRAPHSSSPFAFVPRPVLAMLASGLLLAVGFALGRLSRTSEVRMAGDSRLEPSRTVPTPERRRPSVADVARALPVETTQAVWRAGGPRDARLPPGQHELVSGAARLRLADDLAAELVAPAVVEWRRGDELALRSGRLRVIGRCDEREPIRIATPVSSVRQLSGELELDVDRAGATDVVVRRGSTRIDSLAFGGNANDAEPIALVRGDFDHARIFPPLEPIATAPHVVELSGPDDRFLGRIQVDGAPLEFRSPQVFAATRSHVEQHFRRSPAEFHRLWTQLVQSIGVADDAPATIVVNGRADAAASTDELVEALQQQSASVSVSSSHDGANESFHAVLVVNGKKRTFRSRAEFEAAQREMLAPWKRLQESP